MGSSIVPISQLVAAIRTQLTGRTGPSVKAAARRGVAGPRYAGDHLPALIELRIGQIASDDPQRGSKAFRVFLESVLLSHLGEQMINDPRFFQLLDEVQASMEGDPACGALVTAAIEHLLSDKQ